MDVLWVIIMSWVIGVIVGLIMMGIAMLELQAARKNTVYYLIHCLKVMDHNFEIRKGIPLMPHPRVPQKAREYLNKLGIDEITFNRILVEERCPSCNAKKPEPLPRNPEDGCLPPIRVDITPPNMKPPKPQATTERNSNGS